MTELQLGLLAIGAVVVAGVFAYNFVQERRARRNAQRAFGSLHEDVLLGHGQPQPGVAPRHEAQHSRASPDERIDYVIELALKGTPLPAVVERQWQPIQRRHSPRAMLDGSAASPAWKAGLQLVSRDGAVGEAELIEFRAAVETMAAALEATVAAPEMKSAMESARQIDQLCAQTDIQVVLHVVAPPDGTLAGGALMDAAAAAGLALEVDGRFVLRSAERQPMCFVGSRDGAPFSADQLQQASIAALSLTLDFPHAPDTRRSFEAMTRLAHQLAAACGGSLVDDNGKVLGDAAIEAIAAQLEQVRGVLEARGIAPGSALAARLFS